MHTCSGPSSVCAVRCSQNPSRTDAIPQYLCFSPALTLACRFPFLGYFLDVSSAVDLRTHIHIIERIKYVNERRIKMGKSKMDETGSISCLTIPFSVSLTRGPTTHYFILFLDSKTLFSLKSEIAKIYLNVSRRRGGVS